MMLINKLEKMYESLIEKDDLYCCPVCKKEFKRKGMAQKHLERMDCFRYQDLFDGTPVERQCYEIYAALVAAQYPQARVTLSIFRKSPYYKVVGDFFFFCYRNRVNDMMQYIEYIFGEFNISNSFYSLTVAQKESTLKWYYVWLRKNQTKENCDRWFQFNEKNLEDHDHVLRAFERGDVTLEYFFNRVNQWNFLRSLNLNQKQRLHKIIETI